MSSAPVEPSFRSDGTSSEVTDDSVSGIRSRTGLGRLSVALAFGALAWAVPFSAASSVLLPAKIATLDPGNKIGLLAVIVITGSIVAMIANVVFGALSDLTRSRFGRRNPWIVGGGIVAAVFMALLATAPTVPLLVLWWCLYQAAQNAIIGPIVAVVPDRVQHARRGTVSAVYGVGFLVGLALGSVVGANFIARPGIGFGVLAIVVGVLPLIYALLAPDFSNTDQARVRLKGRDLLAQFSFPTKAPDFYWALIGRLLLVLGYYLISGYQLYILTDYMKLSNVAAGGVISLAALINLGAALLGSVTSGPISDMLRRRKIIVIIASVFLALGSLVPVITPQPWTLLVFAGVGGFGLGIYFSVDAALMSEVLPSDSSRGKDLGILNMANTGGQILAPAVSSLVIGIGFGFVPVFVVACALAVVGALAIVPIRSVR